MSKRTDLETNKLSLRLSQILLECSLLHFAGATRRRSSRSNLPAHTNRGSYIYTIGANRTNGDLNLTTMSPPAYSVYSEPSSASMDRHFHNSEDHFTAPPPSYEEAIQDSVTFSGESTSHTLPDLVTNRNEIESAANAWNDVNPDDAPEEPPSYDEVLESGVQGCSNGRY